MNRRKFLINSMAGTVMDRLAPVSGARPSSVVPGVGYESRSSFESTTQSAISPLPRALFGIADGRRIVIKAVNYRAEPNTLLVQLQGARASEHAVATLQTISARLTDAASLEHPNAIAPVGRPFNY